MKILVTGSRDWPQQRAGVISRFLDKYATDNYVQLLHGACPYGAPNDSPYKGVDGLSDSHARLRGWDVRPFPPRASDGHQRFRIRNQEMVDEDPDVVIAFFLKGAKNAGTWMTVGLSLDAGLYVVTVEG